MEEAAEEERLAAEASERLEAEAWRATQSEEEAPGRVFAVGSLNDFVFCSKAGRGGPRAVKAFHVVFFTSSTWWAWCEPVIFHEDLLTQPGRKVGS